MTNKTRKVKCEYPFMQIKEVEINTCPICGGYPKIEMDENIRYMSFADCSMKAIPATYFVSCQICKLSANIDYWK